jgi:serine/threonine-protein kinase HipA
MHLTELFRTLGKKGPMRISGVQPKLPIHLVCEKGNNPILTLGTLRNSCSYIKSPSFPNLVENEWASMELARRVGLPTAAVRQIEFRKNNYFPGRALLIERYDISRKKDLDQYGSSLRLALQQDAASLLKLFRQDKYKTSAEQIADAMIEVGVDFDQMNLYLKHLLFSWIIGNGDLHAKNVSIISWLAPGKFGAAPAQKLVTYSPLYDLVNTRVHLKGDKFAITINGKNDKFKIKDFAIVAERWGFTKVLVSDIATKLANDIRNNLEEVLELSELPIEQQVKYSSIVDVNIKSMKL